MPRNGGSSSGGSRSGGSRSGGAPRRSTGTGRVPTRGVPARIPPPSAPVRPPPQAPQQGSQAGPSAAGTFGASAAGAVVGTMIGSSLARQGEGGAAAAQGAAVTDQGGYHGKCATEFRALLDCADYNGGDLDRCLQQEDNLQECFGYSRQRN